QRGTQSFKAALVIATMRLGLGAVELEHQASIIVIGEEFDFADGGRDPAARTQFVDVHNRAIDQWRADGALLDGQQLVRGDAKIRQRKLWLAAHLHPRAVAVLPGRRGMELDLTVPFEL